MGIFRKQANWQFYSDRIEELDKIRPTRNSFKPVEVIDESLIKTVPTYELASTDSQCPIIATDSLYRCTGILAYNFDKQQAHLGHSFPSQFTEKNRHGLLAMSDHVSQIYAGLSKWELHQLKFMILVGKSTNKSMINIMINSILALENKRVSIESISLLKTFVEEIHFQKEFPLGGSFAFDI